MALVIGGFIASVPTFFSMYLETYRWRLEKRLEHLRSERVNLEKLSSEVLQNVLKGMIDNDRYDIEMLAEMLVLMPKRVMVTFRAWMTRQDKDAGSARVTYLDLCMKTKQALVEVDEKIKRLLEGGRVWWVLQGNPKRKPK